MILPDTAEVKSLSDAKPGSLLLWQVWEADKEKNIFAICFDKTKKDEEVEKCMAVLNSKNGEDCPYPCSLEHETVFDFGKDWFIDVEIGKEVPDFSGMKRYPLIRKGVKYFLRLAGGHDYTGGYVDLETGDFRSNFPATETMEDARWDDFSICIPQKHNREPVSVFQWKKSGMIDFSTSAFE